MIFFPFKTENPKNIQEPKFAKDWFFVLTLFDTVDGSEIPRPTTVWMELKPVVNNGKNYQAQLVQEFSQEA